MYTLNVNNTGYLNTSDKAGVDIQWSSPIYTSSSSMSVDPIGVLKFTTSFLKILESEQGTIVNNSITSWRDIYFSKVLLKLKKGTDTGPGTTDYKIGVSTTELTASNTSDGQALDTHNDVYTKTNLSCSVSGDIYTFDLTSFFNSFSSSTTINLEPSSSTWFLYLQRPSDSGTRYFSKKSDYTSTLSIEAMVSSGLSYYNENSWIKCVPYYYDGTNWIRCQANYYRDGNWIKT